MFTEMQTILNEARQHHEEGGGILSFIKSAAQIAEVAMPIIKAAAMV